MARAFIHLERGSSPKVFAPFGDLVAPVQGAYQLALALFEAGRVDARAVREAAMASQAGRRKADLRSLADDAVARGLVTRGTLAKAG